MRKPRNLRMSPFMKVRNKPDFVAMKKRVEETVCPALKEIEGLPYPVVEAVQDEPAIKTSLGAKLEKALDFKKPGKVDTKAICQAAKKLEIALKTKVPQERWTDRKGDLAEGMLYATEAEVTEWFQADELRIAKRALFFDDMTKRKILKLWSLRSAILKEMQQLGAK
jgi:hypothetical protein